LQAEKKVYKDWNDKHYTAQDNDQHIAERIADEMMDQSEAKIGIIERVIRAIDNFL